MRHVGGEGDRADGGGLVGPLHGEVAVREGDVGLRRLHQVRCDLPALLDDLFAGADDGGAAHREGAGAVGAHAEGNLARVAMHDLDVLEGHAELVGDHLREGGLMALAVGVAAGQHAHRAGRVEADHGGLVEARAGSERAGHRRGRDAAGLNVGGDAEPPQLAPTLGLTTARVEAGIVRQRKRLVEGGAEVATVVLQRDGVA